MDTLKMKFKLNGLEFEIEGKEETVKAEFENFKSFVSTQLLNKLDIVNPKQVNTSKDTPIIPLLDSHDTPPVLKEIVKRDLPKTEIEWTIVYAFYVSEFGEKTFTDKDIRSQYESSGRRTDNRLSNVSHNLSSLLNKGFIKLKNDSEYIIKETGIKYFWEIIEGKTTVKSSSKKPQKAKVIANDSPNGSDKKSKNSKHNKTVEFIDLGFNQTKITSLVSFFELKAPITQNEEVAVVIKWYSENGGNGEISIQEINYLLSICSSVPAALEQVIINMKGSKFRWVSNGSEGKIKLTSIGEAYVLNKLPKKK